MSETKDKPKVLLVEDYDELRYAIELLLKESYTVFSSESAKKALAELDRDASFQLLLTDFELRGGDSLDGLEIARTVREKCGDIPVVVITANSPEMPRMKTLLAMSNVRLLRKPFSGSDLLKIVSQMV